MNFKSSIYIYFIQKFKNIPKIADFDNIQDFSNALKKFRNTAFKGLNKAQLEVVQSSGFLSQYAGEMREQILKDAVTASGRIRTKFKDLVTLNKKGVPVIKKVLEQKYLKDMFDFRFEKPLIKGVKEQSKIYTQIRNMAKKTLNKAQQINVDYALSQVDKLYKSGATRKAAKMLAGMIPLIAKGVFARVPGIDLLITKEMGSGELPKEGTPEYEELMKSFNKMQDEPEITINAEDALAFQKQQNMRGGGIMDINYMTRPLRGYAGGDYVDRDFDRMSMLKRVMQQTEAERLEDMRAGDPELQRESTYGTVTEDNIIDLAIQIATRQGDTSQENLDSIIRQLRAITPSIEQTMRKELTPTSTKGLKYLLDKTNIMAGQKSDPMLRRDVGFGRVR